MGQSASITGTSSVPNLRNHLIKTKSTAVISPLIIEEETITGDYSNDYISFLPDECLAHIFQFLSSGDRKSCSLVCRQWFLVEGQSRHRLSLHARSDLHFSIPSVFSRFDSVTKLALKCDRRSVSIGDDALVLISLRCRNLTRLKLRACRELTDVGIAAFAKNCKSLSKFSCGSCNFGAKGMNALLDNCSSLQELTVKRLRAGVNDGAPAEPVGPGIAALSLRTICLKDLYNGQCFGPLIVGSKNLKTLKVFRCSGDWDVLFESISIRVTGLVQVHLERIQVSDRGIEAISKCLDLEILHLVKTPECTNASLLSIADRCKFLRKLHIDGWKTNRIGDEGLIAIAKHCAELQELVLIGVNPTCLSLGLLGNCQNLERLAVCGSETIGDSEISCIASKCMALKKLCIKGCPVSNHGLEAISGGCPNLVKVKVKKCRGITCDGADLFRACRGSVSVNLDIGTTENLDTSTSDGGAPEIPRFADPTDVPLTSNARSSMSKARLLLFARRNFAACTFRRLVQQ